MVREKKDLKKRDLGSKNFGKEDSVNTKVIRGVKSVTGLAAFVGAVMLAFTGCAVRLPWGGDGAQPPSPTPGRADTGFVVAGPDSYDSADTAILVGKNEEDGTLTFFNLTVKKKYTLSVDGTTRLYDKYGESLSLEQVEPGDVVDVTFLKSKKHLTTLQKSKQAWSYMNVERYEINTARGEISIGSGVYKLISGTQYLSNGSSIDITDIASTDVLSFQGIDSQILTVRVEKGHGYLRLENDAAFVGGWIEIGQKQIERIKEGMLLVVPEGSHQVNISHKGGGGKADVVVSRGEETVLDVGQFEVFLPQTGVVRFLVSPDETELYIDGVKKDTSFPITLEYGLHQLTASAEGYQPVTRYIRVEKESEEVSVKLDEVQPEQPEPTARPSGGTSGSPSGSPSPEGDYMVHIEAPEGAEVYLDGNYVGIAPCSFKKVSGVHVIILRQSGYETRSYTIQVDNEDKDSHFSFAELIIDSRADDTQP